MTVAQLSAYLKGVFDDEELLHDVTLSGEVSDVSYSDKHTFIVLAEGDYSVRCVHFSSRDKIEKGMRLTLRGSVRFYDKRTAVTFAYTEYSLCGDGAKNAELIKRKERLAAKGYFENRRQLPKYVFNVVAVTSPDGAAIRDFVRVVSDYCPYVNIKIYPVKVQGEGAAEKITAAVKALADYPTDAIVLCRGGGSDEDLDCFNDEHLAETVALSKIPVVSAVGHEVDYTLCDFCAGTRAGTPSIAGQMIGSRGAAFTDDLFSGLSAAYSALCAKFDACGNRIDRLGLRIAAAADSRVAEACGRLESVMYRAQYALDAKLKDCRRSTAETAERLGNAAARMSDRKRMRCEKLTAVLSALDPTRILRSGYAAVTRGGRRIGGAAALAENDEVRLVFADGTASAVIKSVTANGK